MDGGSRGQVEEAGEDGGGELGGEVGERGTASRHGVDAEVTPALAEPGGGDRAAGQAFGEQLWRGGGGSGPSVGAAGAGQLGEDDAKRPGDGRVVPAEPGDGGAAAAGDLAGGHGGDP